ncbi:MAG: PilN domain-containing protein [Gemmatimonadaceae bacterium]
MIEVNLLPGAKRGKKGGRGVSIDFAKIGAAISERVKDKFLAAAVLSGLLAALVIGFLFMMHRGRRAELLAAEAVAVADSARYAVVLRDRMQAIARRDSALIQLNIIRAIDGERLVWPHLLDEVSRALPPYTWLSNITNMVVQGTNPPAAVRMPPPDTARGRTRPRPLPTFTPDSVRVRITGRTVDIQALTRFHRNLEDSPFLGGVQLLSTAEVTESTQLVTQFLLDVTYTRPDSTLLRRTPLTLTPR